MNWLPGAVAVTALVLTSAGLILGHRRKRAMRRAALGMIPGQRRRRH